jgi:hypothetical protein
MMSLETSAVLLVAASAFLAALVLKNILAKFLPTYFAEKGKNLATKEDIGAITAEIEAVKATHAKEIESIRAKNAESIENLRARLSAALEHQNFVRRRLAEIELNGIHSCWRSAINGQLVLNGVRPVDCGTDMDTLLERITQLSRAHNTLLALITKYDPFLDSTVLTTLYNIAEILRLEIAQARREPFASGWWDQGRANRETIETQVTLLRSAVRVRIAALREVADDERQTRG